MPHLNVCTGSAFGTGSLGELEPANVRSAAWPYSTNPTTIAAQMQAANGLRYDQTTVSPGGGLWVPQVGPVASSNRQNGSPGTALPSAASSPVLATLSNVPVQNVSAIQTLSVLATISFMVAVQTGGAAWVELWAGATLTTGTPNIPYGPQVGDYGSTSYTWHGSFTDTMAFTVAPLSTNNIVPQLGVKNATASGGPTATFQVWAVNVGLFAALLDPDTEG